jgi:hypothetical protein
MLKISNNESNLIEATISDTIGTEDIKKLEAITDRKIREHGNIRIFANAAEFKGWEDISSIQEHIVFVKEHHNKIEKIALIIGRVWQQWLADIVSIFVHPQVKIFYNNEQNEAKFWVNN